MRPLINKMFPPAQSVGSLPGISRVEKETAILQASVFIEDGINYRSIFHKLDPCSLRVYRIYHSPWVQRALATVIFIFLVLAFFEYPTSLSISSDPTLRSHVPSSPNFPCGVTEAVEFICLVLFAVDCGMKYYLLGWRRFLQRKWLVLYLVMIALSFPDMFVSLSFCPKDLDNDTPSLGYTLRLRRFFRPLIFLLSSSIMKKLAKAIKLTLPQIFNVLILLVLHLYVFTMIGLLIFPGTQPQRSANTSNFSLNFSAADSLAWNISQENLSSEHCFSYMCYVNKEGDTYFQTVWDGFVNLTVTLTTANHPDIMMPIYRRNRLAALYFITFLIIGLFLLFNVLIAVIYNQFKGFFQKSMQSSFFRRRVAYRAAFAILVRKTRLPGRRNLELVGRDLVRLLLQKAKIDRQFIPDMYQRLETLETEGDCIRWEQFCEVFDIVSRGTRPWRRRKEPTFFFRNRALGWVQLVIRHRYFRWYTHLVTMLNLLLVSIELQRTDLRDRSSPLVIYNFFFILYYATEQVFRLVFLGYREYFSTLGNIYDLFITIILVVLQLLASTIFLSPFERHNVQGGYDALIRLMNVFIVLRLLRVVPHIKRLWLLTNTMVALIRNLSGFAGIIVVVYYFFALLGMEIFSNATTKIVNPDAEKECGSYDNLGYYANNFNDFASSLVVLWDVMIVNNWYVFLNKFARDSHLHEWSKLYFIAWWLVSVVVCVNLFISLVLEIFLVQWEATILRQEQQEAREEGRVGYTDSLLYATSAVNSEGQEVCYL